MTSAIMWDADTAMGCDDCGASMLPNLSTWDDCDIDGCGCDDNGQGGGPLCEAGCAWICTTFTCPSFTGGEIETEDLEALGVPTWVAQRIAALADAYTLAVES